MGSDTYTHCVCVVTPHTENIMQTEQMLHQVLDKLDQTDAKLSSIEGRLTRLEQGQPPVSQFLPNEAVTSAKKPSKAKPSKAKTKRINIPGHPTRATWTDLMKAKSREAYKACKGDYIAKNLAGIMAAKAVA